VAKLGIELLVVGCRVRLDGLGNLFQGGEVGGGIAISERVVGNDVESLLEEG
jgi:hypothetical protein